MTEVTSPTAAPPAPAALRSHPLRRLLRNPFALYSIVVLLALVAAATLAPLIAPFPPEYADLGNSLAAPGGANLLGTDSAGRDIFSRLLWGSQTTLLGVLIVTAMALLVGVPTGLLAGYYGRFLDDVTSWFANILMALPGIIVLLTVRAAVGPSLVIAMIALGIMVSPSYFRLTRSTVQGVRNELYVDAARVAGLSNARIMARHVLLVVRAPLIIQTANVGGIAISVQAGLDFLGLGDPNTVTWGGMVSDGFVTVYQTPLGLLWPALAIGLVTAAFVLLGNALRDALEDAEKVKGKRPVRTAKAAAPDSKDDREHKNEGQAAPKRPEAAHLMDVRNLSIAYPTGPSDLRTVVKDVSFTVDRGEVVGLVGESGSGKSQSAFTALGLLSGAAIVTGGSVSFDDRWLVKPGDAKIRQQHYSGIRGKRIGYIPQEPMSNLDSAFTIGFQLTSPMREVLGISKDEATKRAKDLLASVGIPDPDRTMRAYPHEISGGMAQRVLIAGAISCEPDLLVADEPTTALDVTVQAEVLDVLRDLQQRLGLGVLLITHNFGVVADLCDRVVVMQSGAVVEQGPVRDIIRQPTHEYTQKLLGSMVKNAESRKTARPALTTEER
ncbi:dipeptide/oligopeptide/nickel ABC transporter permease/ATP-binding protein [Arthrobacter sp. NtRootA1]|uniref:dipeptide/oligopeptide/nickel ABC transporter permease/ATP-binding protein n=1 Tax=Arthrobacter sp. NtRootA1 TaxID=2830983 RepID=UPI001CC55C41|nr:dipeptide/oligopeptide/nickel ABC transporter permease/ATP-binding protein [Arthrobacter sp. NtRootA1]